MCSTTSGFEIAQKDLELRGPGDFFGARQHGLPTLKLADLGADTRILKAAQDEAVQILRGDPALASSENKGLAMLVEKLFSHIEGNFLN
jgi:ATP-dependent DNA helicase RecG